MNMEELCGLSSTELKSVIDSGQLAKIAEEHGWLKITRPELAEKPVKKSGMKSLTENTFVLSEKQQKLARAKKIAEQFGFDLGLD